MRLGRVAYEAYRAFFAGRAPDGRVLPEWEHLTQVECDAWEVVALAVEARDGTDAAP